MNAVPAIKENPVTFQSRWGYHPCSYETFRKLKALHKAYWEAVYGLGEWFRWNAKQPQNRVIRRKTKDGVGRTNGKAIVGPWPEPQYCPIFGTPTYKNIWLTIPQHLKDYGIIADYQNARMPKASQEAVTSLRLTVNEIDSLYQKVIELEAAK